MSIFINQSGITLYQALHPETLPVSITEPELVLESELPNRLQTINDDIDELKDKTQNFNIEGSTLSNIININGIKIGVPHSWNFIYWDYAPFIPVCNAFSGSMTVGHTIIFKDEYGADYAGAILSCNARGQLEIMGRFSADMYKTDVGFALRQYKNTSMKFMKYDDTTSMLTLNSLDDTATFLGNVLAPNITSLENKTQAITYETEGDKTIIANTTETGNLKVTYDTETYTLTVGSHATFSGSTFFSATINGYNIENELSKLQYLSTMDDITEVSGPFRASNLVGITYDADLNTTFFSGNLSSLNISALEDNLANLIGIIGGVTGFSGNLQADDFVTTSGTLNAVINNTQNITRVPGTEEGDPSYTEIDGVSFQTTLGRITNIEFTLSNVSYDPITPCTNVAGGLVVGTLNGNKIGTPSSFIYNNYSPYIPVCDSDGVIEVGASIAFHDLSAEQDNRCRLSCIGTNILELSGVASMRMTRIDVSAGMALRTGYTLMKFTKSDPAINMLTLDATTDVATFSGNVVAPNLTGIAYNNNFLLQTTSYTTATVISNHLHVNLTDIPYKPLLGIRAYKGDLASDQEVMIQVGKGDTRAISFVYKYNSALDNSQYRLDFAGRTAYTCNYGATKTEHEIKGNLTVFGTVTENASKTITHYTMYEGELQPGCFVETTGQIFRDPNSKLSPYEDCITVVRQATSSNNKIVGVCTEIINEEVTDDYGNINQPAGKYCKYATHGDVLIKCISAVYNVGEILIPTANGYAKKGQQGEILDAMLNMIPRAKITSVETAEIDSETVCAFISI